jgi:hypothetical protein
MGVAVLYAQLIRDKNRKPPASRVSYNNYISRESIPHEPIVGYHMCKKLYKNGIYYFTNMETGAGMAPIPGNYLVDTCGYASGFKITSSMRIGIAVIC